MKVFINEYVYWRAKEVAKSQGKNLSKLVEEALVILLGLEGLTLEDEIVFGHKKDEQNNKIN